MSAKTQYTQKEAQAAMHRLLFQWANNVGELHHKSKSNQKVQEVCQSLGEAIACVDNWLDLNGSVTLIAAYQPGMFDDEEFGKGADWSPV